MSRVKCQLKLLLKNTLLLAVIFLVLPAYVLVHIQPGTLWLVITSVITGLPVADILIVV